MWFALILIGREAFFILVMGGGENFFSMFRGIIEIIGIEWLRKQAGLPACFLN